MTKDTIILGRKAGPATPATPGGGGVGGGRA